MSQNDGEKELVLGNKQLLGIFFVAMLLCGVFFAMGYVVGGNSTKSGAAATATDAAPASVADGKREQPQVPPDTAATAQSPDIGGALPGAEPKVADNPAAAGSAPITPTANASGTPAPAPKEVVPAPALADSGVGVSVKEAGATYLQVAALGRPAADDLVKTLRKRELPAILAESSKADLYSVLVGPYRSTLALADGKNKLKTLGFNDVFIHKP